jgi:hypothetical protein
MSQIFPEIGGLLGLCLPIDSVSAFVSHPTRTMNRTAPNRNDLEAALIITFLLLLLILV